MSDDLRAEEETLLLAHDLRLVCQMVSRRVRYEGSREIAPHCVNVLWNLGERPCLVGELACRERVSAPSMTRTVNHLVELGLAVKKASPDDGRQVLVEITQQGSAVVERIVSDRDSWMFARLAELDEDKLAKLKELMPVLREVVDG